MVKVLIIVGLLLLIPFIGMQLTIEINWSIIDFIIMSLLLIFFGSLIRLALKRIQTLKKRIFVILFIIVSFLLLWFQLAVGLFYNSYQSN